MPKKGFFKIFSKNVDFLSDFLEFLLFFLNLGLNPHIHLFFSPSVALVGSQSKIFRFFKKPFVCIFWTLPL